MIRAINSANSAARRQPCTGRLGTPAAVRSAPISRVAPLVRVAVGIIAGFCLQTSPRGEAAEQVVVVAAADAPGLEQLAARELAGQFRRLFDGSDVVVTAVVPPQSKYAVLIGSPATNPAVRAALAGQWPKVTDQGIVLKSLDADGRQTLIVGGGSPVATLWAAYELGHRLGVRYLFRGDIFPQHTQPLRLTGQDVVMEPELRTRTWRTINDFASGPESWGLADHTKLLRQLAKMKFNQVMLSVYPWHPYVSYEFGGVRKETAVLWWGNQFRVDGDTVGKKVFRGAQLFQNPDFAGAVTPTEMAAAGTRQMRGLIDAAHELGMSVGVSISPLEFPREFQPVLPGSKTGTGLGQLTIVPGPEQRPDDPRLRKLVATMISAWKETYPALDRLYLTLPEFPEWDQHAEDAFRMLQAEGALADVTLDQLVAAAAGRKLVAGGARGELAVRGNLVALAFFRSLFADQQLLSRPDGRSLDLVITSVDPGLFPMLDQVVPPGAGTLNFIDYTARRSVEHRELLSQVPASRVRSQLILTLADDNVGILPQSSLQSLGTLLDDLKQNRWDGFSTRYWELTEHDTAVYFLSRAAWQSPLTARGALTELWTTATGNASAADRLWLAWEALENATNLIDQNDPGFAFPVPGMLMKHYTSDPLPEWWQPVTDAYTQYMTELYRANSAIEGDAKPVLFYYAKRSEYVLFYLDAVKAVRLSAIASKAGDKEQALQQLELAVENIYNGITALADVAVDQSDRGLVAVLNEYAYRPLLQELERLSNAE